MLIEHKDRQRRQWEEKMSKSSRQNTLKKYLLVGASLGCLSVPGMAFAQEAEPDAESQRKLSTVTVIARKQAETLQEVPVTVTAIEGETLEKFQIDQVADIVSRVPTLNVQVGGSGSGCLLYTSPSPRDA